MNIDATNTTAVIVKHSSRRGCGSGRKCVIICCGIKSVEGVSVVGVLEH